VPRLSPATKVERRRQLIDAAWRCLAERGFQSLTVDDVCSQAGVSKGSFYVYFEQKQDLLLALVDDEAAEMDDVMQALEHGGSTSVDRLRRFVRAMLEHGDDPARLQVRADLLAEMSSDTAVRERWTAVVRSRREALKRWIDEGVSAGELSTIPANAFAAILLALGDGLLIHAGLDPSGFQWANVRTALDAILEGIGER
jgi:AcrR family transcriptional regulator